MYMACRFKEGNAVTIKIQKTTSAGTVNAGTKGTVHQCVPHRSAYYIDFMGINTSIWVYDSELK